MRYIQFLLKVLALLVCILVSCTVLSMTFGWQELNPMFWIITHTERAPAGVVRLLGVSKAIWLYQDNNGKLPFEDELIDKYGKVDRLLTEEEYALIGNIIIKYAADNLASSRNQLLSKKGGLLDDWGNPYRIVYDLDRDGVIDGSLINGRGTLGNCTYGYVIWSIGPDGREEIPFTDDNRGFNKDNKNGFSRY